MNTNSRPTKLSIAIAALAAIGTAGTSGVSGYSSSQWSNNNVDRDDGHDDHDDGAAQAYGQVLPNYGNPQYNNGGNGNGLYNYGNGNFNGVNNYNTDVFSPTGHQQFIPIVQQPVNYQNNGYPYQNIAHSGQYVQSGNFLFTNTAVSKDQSKILLPNVNSAILVQGTHQDADGNFNTYDPVTAGLNPNSPNLIWPGIPDPENKRKRRNSKSDKDDDNDHGNWHGDWDGNWHGNWPNKHDNSDIKLIDPRQGIPFPQPFNTFPANDHDTGIVSKSSNNFQGFPIQTVNKYVPQNGQIYPPKPIDGYPPSYGTQYNDGVQKSDPPQYIPNNPQPLPQVIQFIPGAPLSSIPAGSLIAVPQNNQGYYGYGNGDFQGQVGPNLRKNGCQKCP